MAYGQAMAQASPSKYIKDSTAPQGEYRSDQDHATPNGATHATPSKVNVSGEGGAGVALRAMGSGCDIEPITMRAIPSDTCNNLIGYVYISAQGMFPSIAFTVETAGEYDITFEVYSMSASLGNELASASLWPSGSVYLDVKEDTELRLGEKFVLKGNLKTAKKLVMDWFRKVAEKYCSRDESPQIGNIAEAPCTGFDTAIGEGSSRWASPSAPPCSSEVKADSYLNLAANTLYYVRLIQNNLQVGQWSAQKSHKAALYIRRRCCDDATTSNGFKVWASMRANSGSCPCEVNPDAATQKTLSSIYAKEIENAEHRKIQLFEATLSGAEDYKFSFDPSFSGQVVFYKSNGRASYEELSVIGSQAFEAADGMQDILLDKLGDCATIYMALASDPCVESDLDATVSRN
jgi:hypothetical protein